MNIQHSSRTDAWATPQPILDRARMVLGGIEFDPASSELFNSRVRARSFMSEQDDSLSQEWPSGNVFLNPPGGKIGNKSKTVLFWQKLLDHRGTGRLTHGIFLAFSLEALQTTQQTSDPIANFPICVPKKRIAFVTPEGIEGTAPSHSNVIVYVPGTINKTELFYNSFMSLGSCMNIAAWCVND